jgi:hypothetical protein
VNSVVKDPDSRQPSAWLNATSISVMSDRDDSDVPPDEAPVPFSEWRVRPPDGTDDAPSRTDLGDVEAQTEYRAFLIRFLKRRRENEPISDSARSEEPDSGERRELADLLLEARLLTGSTVDDPRLVYLRGDRTDAPPPPSDQALREAVRRLRHSALVEDVAARITRYASEEREARSKLNEAVAVGRAAGMTWADIAAHAGMTKQAAHARWSDKGQTYGRNNKRIQRSRAKAAEEDQARKSE